MLTYPLQGEMTRKWTMIDTIQAIRDQYTRNEELGEPLTKKAWRLITTPTPEEIDDLRDKVQMSINIFGLSDWINPDIFSADVKFLTSEYRQWKFPKYDITFIHSPSPLRVYSLYIHGKATPRSDPRFEFGINYDGKIDIGHNGASIEIDDSKYETFRSKFRSQFTDALKEVFLTNPELTSLLASSFYLAFPLCFSLGLIIAERLPLEAFQNFRASFQQVFNSPRDPLHHDFALYYPVIEKEDYEETALISDLGYRQLIIDKHMRSRLAAMHIFPPVNIFSDEQLQLATSHISSSTNTLEGSKWIQVLANLRSLFSFIRHEDDKENVQLDIRSFPSKRPIANWDAQTSTFIVGIPQDCHSNPKDDEKCEKCQIGMVLLSAIRSFVRKEWQNLKYAEHLALPSTPKLFKIVMQHTNYLNTAHETIFGESVPSDANDQFSDDDFSEAERILGLSPDLFRQLMQAIKKEIELKRKHDEELAKPKKKTRRKKDAVEKTSK